MTLHEPGGRGRERALNASLARSLDGLRGLARVGASPGEPLALVMIPPPVAADTTA
jgi:hypothetical protein